MASAFVDVYLVEMQWNDLPNSELARRLKAKELSHAAFDDATWIAAVDAISEPTERDLQLGFVAIHFGRELSSLRVAAIPATVAGHGSSGCWPRSPTSST